MLARYKHVLPFLVIAFSVLVPAFHSLNASALSINTEVEQIDVIQTPYWRYYVSGVGDSTYATSTVNRKPSDANITRIQLRDNANHDIAFTAGNYIEIGIWAEFYLAQYTGTDPLQTGYFDITGASSNCNIIKFDTFSQNWIEGTTVSNLKNWLRWEGSIICALKSSGTNPTVNLTVKSNGVSSSLFEGDPTVMRFGVKSYTVYKPVSAAKSIQEQTQQQQDQYEQEKQEEAEREESNSEANDSIGSMFNFNVLNPFAPIFNLFSSSCSVGIPTIAGWIHAPSSTYTSWWCSGSLSSIRSTLTPVIGLSSSVLLFGFVVRKVLNGSSFNGGIEIE